jgi:ABC-type transport system involved in multi-copper enzyme maturation permease subunit
MTFLPIAARELLALSRRRGTFRLRLWIAALAVLAFFAGFFLFSLGAGRGKVGAPLFGALSGYAFGLCAMAGVFLTADAISEEKREGTLGLLFLSGLSGFDVVLGKSVAMILNAFYGLLAILPVLGLPMLMGGVTGDEFGRMVLALVNTLFFSLAAGLFVSSFSLSSQRAMVLTGGLLLLIVGVLPALIEAGVPGRFRAVARYSGWGSPFYPFQYARESLYLTQPGTFWGSLAGSILAGWALIGVASWRLPRSVREPTGGSGLDGFLRRWARGDARARREKEAARTRLLPLNPIAWLANRDRTPNIVAWAIVCLWGIFVLAVLFFAPRGSALLVAGRGGLPLFGFLLKTLVAFQACRFFMETRQSGSLELLLCTGLAQADLIRGQALALREAFLRPAIVFLCFLFVPNFAQMAAALVGLDFSQAMGGGLGTFYLGIGSVRFIADLLAVAWVGLWLSLSMRKPGFAPAVTILVVLILPTMLCWLDLLVDIILISWATSRLQLDFRWVLARKW